MKIAMILIFLLLAGTVVAETTCGVCVCNDSKEVELKDGLQIALVVLVVLLTIVGLVIGFRKLNKEDDDEDKYY